MYKYITQKESKSLTHEELLIKLQESEKELKKQAVSSVSVIDHSHNMLMSNFELGQELRKLYTEHFLCETALNELKLEFKKLNPDNTNHQINYIVKSHDYFVDIYRTLEKDYNFMNDFLVGIYTSELDCQEEIRKLKKQFNRKEIFEKINELLKEKEE